MALKLKPRDKKVLLLGTAAAVLILFVTLVVVPFWEKRSDIAPTVQTRTEALKKRRALVAQKDEFVRRRDENEKKLKEMQARLLDTNEPEAALIKLEEIIRQIARENNVRIDRTNPIQEKKIGDQYSRISLSIGLSGQVEDLTRFLVAVNQHPKYLLTDQLQVSSAQIRASTIITPRVTVSALIMRKS